MTIILLKIAIGLLAWLGLSVPFALLLGRVIAAGKGPRGPWDGN